MKLNLGISFFLLVLSLGTFAAPKMPVASGYKSGRVLCGGEYSKLLVHENGVFVSVPADYSNPAAGNTEVYAFVAGGKLDSSLPTLIYFTGGPGQGAHWGMNITNAAFNIILMDQRGIGCSRPSLFSQFVDPGFYSSENVARDADEIRKYFGISEVSVYGVSYGTMPATIYGSLFPSVTRSVILEGVVFAQSKELWESSARRQLIQGMLDGLPSEIKEILESVSRVHGVPNTWLSMLAWDSLLHNDGLNTLREKFLDLGNPQQLKRLLEHVRGFYEEVTYEPHMLFTINEIPYYMIACQEMGLALPGISSRDAYVNGKLSPVADEESPRYCAQMGARSRNLYSANKYPLTVPTYYFQGRDDSATVMSEAVSHFQKVPRGKKSLLLMDKGGHAPSMTFLKMDNVFQLGIFTHAVMGETIPESLVEMFNAENPRYSWTYTR
ncbi:Proline iminopeptidase [compost metagenome]